MEPPCSAPGADSTGPPDDELRNSRLEWVVWPVRSHVLPGLLVFVLIGVLSATVRLSLDSRFYAGLCFVLLVLAVLPYYLPAHYLLDPEGVHVRSLLGHRRKAWEHFRVHFRDGERGVLLSPVLRYGTLARTRGTYLPCPRNCRQIAAFVARYLPAGELHQPPRDR